MTREQASATRVQHSPDTSGNAHSSDSYDLAVGSDVGGYFL